MGYRDGNDPVLIDEKAIVLRATAKAILVGCGPVEFWVPKAAVHDDSEVFDMLDGAGPGKLVLLKWFARKEGLL